MWRAAGDDEGATPGKPPLRANRPQPRAGGGSQRCGCGFLNNAGDTERKQVIPVRRENCQCKCINIIGERKKQSICAMAKNKESLLAKIKCMTREQMNILNNDTFNQEVGGLKRRVEEVECAKTHGEIVKTTLKKVSELERHMDAVLALRKGGAVPQKPSTEIRYYQSEMKKIGSDRYNVRKPVLVKTFEQYPVSLQVSTSCQGSFVQLAEEFEDPPENPKTKRGFCPNCEGDWTVMEPYRN